MTYLQRVSTAILATTVFISTSSAAFAESDKFHQALSRTQEQKHSLGARELEILGQQLQKRGDLANAYRSQATSILIQYGLDPYRYAVPSENIEGSYNLPKWYLSGSCWGDDRDGFSGGNCEFGIEWMQPPTKIKNFGGVIVLDNKLVSNSSKENIRGILDVVVLPKLKANESVISSCEITSSSGNKQGVLALVTYNAKLKKYTKVRQAWYPNVQVKRFQSVDSKKVICPPPYDPEG